MNLVYLQNLLDRSLRQVQTETLIHDLTQAREELEREIEAEKEQEKQWKEKPIGICPACKQTVFRGDEDVVWVCPRDLSPSNPYWEASEVTEEDMEKDGIYSKCYEDHGGWCSDHMPLHSACYEKGEY